MQVYEEDLDETHAVFGEVGGFDIGDLCYFRVRFTLTQKPGPKQFLKSQNEHPFDFSLLRSSCLLLRVRQHASKIHPHSFVVHPFCPPLLHHVFYLLADEFGSAWRMSRKGADWAGI